MAVCEGTSIILYDIHVREEIVLSRKILQNMKACATKNVLWATKDRNSQFGEASPLGR